MTARAAIPATPPRCGSTPASRRSIPSACCSSAWATSMRCSMTMPSSATRRLGLTLTQRTAGIPMAGVPYHAVEGYLRRMIEQGYRVAVCEQIAGCRGSQRRRRSGGRPACSRPARSSMIRCWMKASANTIAAIHVHRTRRSIPQAVLACAELSTGAFTLFDCARPIASSMSSCAWRRRSCSTSRPADGNIPPRVEAIRLRVDAR